MNTLAEDKVLVLEVGSYSIKVKVGTDDVGSLPNLEIRSQLGIPISKLTTPNEKTTTTTTPPPNTTTTTATELSQTAPPTTTTTELPPSSNDRLGNSRQEFISDEELTKLFKEGKLVLGTELASYSITEKGTGEKGKEETGESMEEGEEEIKEPFQFFDLQREGKVVDWLGLKFLLIHLLVTELEITISDNDSAILVATPLSWSKSDLEQLTQLCFETLNVPALYLLPQPLATLYGYGVGNGLVVDMGYTTTKFTPIVDSVILNVGYRTLPFGTKQLDLALLDYIKNHPTLSKALHPLTIDLELVQYLREAGSLTFNPIKESDSEEDQPDLVNKVANTDASPEEPSPSIKVDYRGVTLEVDASLLDLGNILFPILDDDTPQSVLSPPSPGRYARSILETILSVIHYFDIERRQVLWDNIVLSGGFSCAAGLGKRLEQSLLPLLPQSENFGTSQTTTVKVPTMPEYFTQWRGNPHLATILGSTITAKFVFADPKLHITKLDYSDSGPLIIHNKTG